MVVEVGPGRRPKALTQQNAGAYEEPKFFGLSLEEQAEELRALGLDEAPFTPPPEGADWMEEDVGRAAP